MQKKQPSSKTPEEVEAVKELIQTANLVPFGTDVESLKKILQPIGTEIDDWLWFVKIGLPNETAKMVFNLYFVRLIEALNPYPLLLNYLNETPLIGDMEYRFKQFTHIWKILNEVVNYSERYRENEEKGRSTFPAEDIPSAQLFVDDSGKLTFSVDPILSSLLGFDLARFKRCLFCRNIFFANRLNKQFCSVKCSNAHHQKLYLKNPEKRKEYNEKRKETYKNIKDREKNRKEKKNGTL